MADHSAVGEPVIIDSRWRPVIRLAAVTAIAVVVIIPVQALVFILLPPPTTVLDFFQLFAQNPVLGLVDLDLLLTIDYLAMLPLYLALFATIEHPAHGWAALALVLGLLSLTLFFVTRDATFSLWQLGAQYADAGSGTDRAALVASGQTLLTLYNGGTFGMSYILGALSTLLFSAVMLSHRVFGRLTGTVGIATGITMLIPPNVGPIGLMIALLSLIPTGWWLILLSRGFLRLLRTSQEPISGARVATR